MPQSLAGGGNGECVAAIADVQELLLAGEDRGYVTSDEIMALVDDCDLTFLHVFPYSARKGTPAARMPQLPVADRKARAAELRAAGERRLATFLAGQVGAEVSLLMEKPGEGRSEHYAPARLNSVAAIGSVVRARVEDVVDGALMARAA